MDILTKILGAAADLFRQYGFKTITMDDISRRAGISKKTLYQHFANKNEVLKETMSWYKENVYCACTDIMNGADNAIEAMVRMMHLFSEMQKQINPLAIMELQRFYPEAFAIFKQDLLEKDVEALKQNMLQGIADDLYRPEINVDLLARLRIEMTLLTLQPNLLVNDRYDLQFLNEDLTEHFLYGIMTSKGEKLYKKYKENYQKQLTK